MPICGFLMAFIRSCKANGWAFQIEVYCNERKRTPVSPLKSFKGLKGVWSFWGPLNDHRTLKDSVGPLYWSRSQSVILTNATAPQYCRHKNYSKCVHFPFYLPKCSYINVWLQGLDWQSSPKVVIHSPAKGCQIQIPVHNNFKNPDFSVLKSNPTELWLNSSLN